MKTVIKNTLALSALLTAFSLSTFAQELRSSYFMQTSLYNHQMNPALLDKPYISMPSLGNMNIGTSGNLGYGTFVYSGSFTDSQGKRFSQTTFMNPDISANDFLGKLKEKNHLNANVNMNIISLAFRGFGGTNLIEANVRSNTSVCLPYQLFEFMKCTGESEHYNISNIGVRSQNYVELALGHSHKINRNLTIGAKVKVLLGAAYADIDVKNLDVTMNDDRWIINSDARINAAVLESEIKYNNDNDIATTQQGRKKVKGIENVKFGIPGLGFATDLGATYKLSAIKGLTISAAVNDLGFISWKNINQAASKSDEPFVFDGFTDIATVGNNNGENKLGDQFDKLADDLEKVFSVYDEGKTKKSTMLAATINVGAQYAMLGYDKLRFGLLYSNRINGIYSYSQTMLSANIRPVKFIELSVNGSTTTSGWCYGGMLSIFTKGFNFYVGSDRILGKVNKQYIPLSNMNANVNFGINIPL